MLGTPSNKAVLWTMEFLEFCIQIPELDDTKNEGCYSINKLTFTNRSFKKCRSYLKWKEKSINCIALLFFLVYQTVKIYLFITDNKLWIFFKFCLMLIGCKKYSFTSSTRNTNKVCICLQITISISRVIYHFGWRTRIFKLTKFTYESFKL